MSVAIESLRFIDSLQFINASLLELVQNLKKKDETGFRILEEVFGTFKSKLLMRKGVYPYDYISSWTTFNETSLPPRRMFLIHLPTPTFYRKTTNMQFTY